MFKLDRQLVSRVSETKCHKDKLRGGSKQDGTMVAERCGTELTLSL